MVAIITMKTSFNTLHAKPLALFPSFLASLIKGWNFFIMVAVAMTLSRLQSLNSNPEPCLAVQCFVGTGSL